MIQRLDAVIHDLERQRDPVMIVGHQVVWVVVATENDGGSL